MMDHIFTIYQIIENCIRRAKEVHVAVIDLEKSCDNACNNRVWKEMEKFAVRGV
jgi:hypothetical protein